MKVCYIFREKERGAHSIEILFETISNEVNKKGIDIEKWYKPVSLFKSILGIRKLKADIYHITGDCYFLSLFLPKKKTIMTIHDIGMYKNHKRTLKKKIFAFLSFTLPMSLLKLSTVISNLTKNDLIEILGIDNDKLVIISNPLVFPMSYLPKEINKIKPTILQIGTGPHKNLENLIEAVKELDCKLDIVGNPKLDLIEKMKFHEIEFTVSRNISNEEIIDKYKNCDILYFASLSEGFGLPILEAQAVGRSVITSNLEPMISVYGKGGVLVNPEEPLEIKKAIDSLLNDDDLRKSCISNGLINVKRYEKQKIAEEYISVYNQILN